MKAYAIYGEQDSGKSTACFNIYNLLLKAGGIVKKSDPATVTNPSKPPKADFTVLIDFHGKTILITSAGDFGTTVAANIQQAIGVQPDYFIFTIRKGSRYKASVNHLQNTINSNVIFLTLPRPLSPQDKVNNETEIANQLLNLLV